MYEKLHILSPLVDAREFLFIHCCKQLDHKTWIMLDVSYDLLKEIQTCAPSYAWKFPSGCIIQDMGYRTSLVRITSSHNSLKTLIFFYVWSR